MLNFRSLLSRILLIISLFPELQLYAQAPQKMSYQAVIRNTNNELIRSTAVGVKISILTGSLTGSAIYVETQKPLTNDNGLISLEIGTGTILSGTFSSIDWANGPFFIKTETDPTGGSNYTISGTNELLSVPYALYSANVIPGPQGPIGLTGPAGEKGPAGSPGVQGVKGEIGEIGLAGNDGQNGSTIAGNNIKITGAGTVSDPYIINAEGQALGTTPGQMEYWNTKEWLTISPGTSGQPLRYCNGAPTWGTSCKPEITSPTTGRVWMDRNLGATQVATSSTDPAALGYLYQWGRGNDGHQLRTSLNTENTSNSDVPGHSYFILSQDPPYDWRVNQITDLWNGVNGINNPCPSGFRLPTSTEFQEELAGWSSKNSDGAFASPLKLTAAGYRKTWPGTIDEIGVTGRYWLYSSNTSYKNGYLQFSTSDAFIGSGSRPARGYSVRCIKD